MILSMEINVKKLEREIARLGLSKKELCRKLGMHYQGWDYIMRTRQTKLKTIQRIADFFEMEAKDILL
jgi:DNA-binding Xre family transcriptional regulator